MCLSDCPACLHFARCLRVPPFLATLEFRSLLLLLLLLTGQLVLRVRSLEKNERKKSVEFECVSAARVNGLRQGARAREREKGDGVTHSPSLLSFSVLLLLGCWRKDDLSSVYFLALTLSSLCRRYARGSNRFGAHRRRLVCGIRAAQRPRNMGAGFSRSSLQSRAAVSMCIGIRASLYTCARARACVRIVVGIVVILWFTRKIVYVCLVSSQGYQHIYT